jgi:hypothetical protein
MFLYANAADGQGRRLNGRNRKKMLESLHNKKIQINHNPVYFIFHSAGVVWSAKGGNP